MEVRPLDILGKDRHSQMRSMTYATAACGTGCSTRHSTDCCSCRLRRRRSYGSAVVAQSLGHQRRGFRQKGRACGPQFRCGLTPAEAVSRPRRTRAMEAQESRATADDGMTNRVGALRRRRGALQAGVSPILELARGRLGERLDAFLAGGGRLRLRPTERLNPPPSFSQLGGTWGDMLLRTRGLLVALAWRPA